MRAWLHRARPFALLLLALFLTNAAAMALVFSNGIAFSASALGLFLQLAVTLALVAASVVIFTRVARIPKERAGLRLDRVVLVELGLATVVGVVAVALLAAMHRALGLLELVPIHASIAPEGSTIRLALPLLVGASWVNALFQQLGLQGLIVALGPDGRPTRTAAALSLSMFVGTHAAESQAPLYLANVALFGAVTCLLFFRTEPPSYGAAVGLHGGWNAAMIALGLVPGVDGAAFFRASSSESLWSGGEAGIESGALYLLAMLVLTTASFALRRSSAPRT